MTPADMMFHLNSDQTLAMIAGTSFAAGLNVYATVGALELLSRSGLVQLPSGLHLVESWWVIGVCLAMFALELFATEFPSSTYYGTRSYSTQRFTSLHAGLH